MLLNPFGYWPRIPSRESLEPPFMMLESTKVSSKFYRSCLVLSAMKSWSPPWVSPKDGTWN